MAEQNSIITELKIKLLDESTFMVDITDVSTIAELKQKLYTINNDFEVAKQKILLLGKVMKDADILPKHKFTKTSFAVLAIPLKKKKIKKIVVKNENNDA